MDTESTRQLVSRFIEARSAGDTATMAELLTDDAVWQPPVSVGFGPFRGKEEVVKALAGGAAGKLFDLATMKRTVRKIMADGDSAAVQQTLTATTRKGKPYENDYCWVYVCRDDKVAHLDEYADTLNAARIFGWVDK
jgi:uncharacterized protein (TIGR02246 family)